MPVPGYGSPEALRRHLWRIATAIFVAIPTTIARSVGMAGLVFRRRLFCPGQGPQQT
ncbi:hypothetical protein [Nocardiopsis sp. Huas11]|uniref:hypothetical protein n=1 Tax=Nocardiopsis sp. Huas11 TaxID=2183912 RepID=UPI00131578FD|nr:hypothetical protein [Nocardiopsis sp. Huas11]